MSTLGALPRFPSRTLHRLLPFGARFTCAEGAVALTFDDGPDEERTPRILDVLGDLNVKATFFLVGEKAACAPELARRIAAEGHAVGSHSWSHAFLPRLDDAQLHDEFHKTQALLTSVCGAAPTLFRPPYGWGDARVYREAQQAGLALVLWNFDSFDYLGLPEVALRWRLGRARPGDIALLHDGSPLARATPHVLAAALRRHLDRGTRFAPLANDAAALWRAA